MEQQSPVHRSSVLNRREALLGMSGASAFVLGGAAAAVLTQPAVVSAQTLSCVLSPQMTEGPYWVDEMLNRSDIRIDPADNSVVSGLPLALTINLFSVTSAGCSTLPNAVVDVWHCDAAGRYSDVSANQTVGRKFLRGYQVTNSAGQATFTTIYPGWYQGRAVHIHIRIRTLNGTTVTGNFTTQLFFDDTITDTVYQLAPYNTRGTRDTRNANDSIYNGSQNRERTLATLTPAVNGYAAVLNVGVNMTPGTTVATTSYALPQAAFGGGWYTAVYLANTNAASAVATLNFVAASGAPLAVTLPGLGSNASHAINLNARATSIVELPDSGSLTEGWIEAQLPDGILGYAVFRQSVQGRADQEAVVPLAPQTATQVQLIYDDVNFTTGIALVNPGNQQTVLTITAYNGVGSQVGSGSLTLAARSKSAVVLREISGLTGVAGSRGWLSIVSSAGVVGALGLRFGSQAFTSIPATHR